MRRKISTLVSTVLCCLPLVFLSLTTISCSKDTIDEDDDPYIEYPYISAIGLYLFDGEDPLSDAEPIYSFLDKVDVILNPWPTCQLELETREYITGDDIAGTWGLQLHSRDLDIAGK